LSRPNPIRVAVPIEEEEESTLYTRRLYVVKNNNNIDINGILLV